MLRVLVDKWMVVGALKRRMQSAVGVPMEFFKLYRIYTSQQEYECSRLNESLCSFKDEEKLRIRLGRALRQGEYRGKVFYLRENSIEHTTFLCEWVLSSGITVGQFKGDLLREKQVDIPFERCRLRKKNWKTPAKIYLDSMKFGDDILLYSNWELFIQDLCPIEENGVATINDNSENIIDEVGVLSNHSELNKVSNGISPHKPEVQKVYENVTCTDQLAIFVKRWLPSKMEFGKFQEVVMDGVSVDEFKEKLSALSKIPFQNIEIAKAPNPFPSELSILSIHSELEWNPQTSALDVWPLNVVDDGWVFFYRDKTEPLRELTAEERREIASKEGNKFGRYGSTPSTSSPRREKALKIYLDNSPKKKDLGE